jgi:hypothetical protein
MVYTLPQEFEMPYCVAVDGEGNTFVGSGGEKTVKRVGRDGAVSILLEDQSVIPEDLAVGPDGSVYVVLVALVDRTFRVVRIMPDGRQTTLAGLGQYGTRHVAVDRQGQVFVSNSQTHVIEKIAPDGTVSVFAGSGSGDQDGPGSIAQFRDPRGLAVDAQGNVYVADMHNSKIRKIDSTGHVSTLAASIPNPDTLAIDGQGNLFVPLQYGNAILRVSPEGQVTWWTGDGVRCYNGPLDPNAPGYYPPEFPDPCETLVNGPRLQARFLLPRDIAVDAHGSVYLVEGLRRRLRRIESGPAPEPAFSLPLPSPMVSPLVEDMALAAISAPSTGLVNRPMAIEVTGILPDAGWMTHRAEAVVDAERSVVTLKVTRRKLNSPRPTEALRPTITVFFYPPQSVGYTIKARIRPDGQQGAEQEVVLPISATGGSPMPPEPRSLSPDPNSPPPSPPSPIR